MASATSTEIRAYYDAAAADPMNASISAKSLEGLPFGLSYYTPNINSALFSFVIKHLCILVLPSERAYGVCGSVFLPLLFLSHRSFVFAHCDGSCSYAGPAVG